MKECYEIGQGTPKSALKIEINRRKSFETEFDKENDTKKVFESFEIPQKTFAMHLKQLRVLPITSKGSQNAA